MIRTTALAGLALAMPMLLGFAAEARPQASSGNAGIVCHDEFQSVNGQQIATPYCEDSYLAKVARDNGDNVRGAQLRRSEGLKDETCRFLGSDSRVNEICDNNDPLE